MTRVCRSPRPVRRREELTARLVDNLHSTHDSWERQRLTDELVLVNLPLCDALATRYAGRGADFDDLVQVARAALVVAVQHFRPDKAPSLAAFAVPTITGELKRYFRDRCWMVRPPRSLQELRPRVVQARRELEQQLGRTVTMDDVATHLDVDARTAEEALWARGGYRPASLDAPLQAESSVSLGTQLDSGTDLADDVTQHVALHEVLEHLPEEDRRILVWRFEEECTQTEIAARLGVSQMQVSRMLRRILDGVRAGLDADD